MRKTKIICTIGPASSNEDVLTAMLQAGMDVAMIPGEERNFKITTPEDLNRFELLIQESSAVKADRD